MSLYRWLFVFVLSFVFVAQEKSFADFPTNNLHLQDEISRRDTNITEAQFNQIIDDVSAVYSPIVQKFGASLVMRKLWTDSLVNASAQQEGKKWLVIMFGGMARRPEVTRDAFTLVVCHELGHHLGGFPIYSDSSWAAIEGQADYFASHVCLPKLWKDQIEKNALSRNIVHPIAKDKCDSAWKTHADQDLCYRIAMAGKSMADLLAVMPDEPTTVDFADQDHSEVIKTRENHPPAQCRLDTYTSGALCGISYDDNVIPGIIADDDLSAEREAYKYSCAKAYGEPASARPRCWFGPKVDSPFYISEWNWSELVGNQNGAIEPGDTFALISTLQNFWRGSLTDISADLSATHQNVSITSKIPVFPNMPYASEAKQSEPFLVSFGKNLNCGEIIPFELSVSANGYTKKFNLARPVGSLVGLPTKENKQLIRIPTNDAAIGVDSNIQTPGAAQAVTTASVKINLYHFSQNELTIVLTDPNGDRHILHNKSENVKDDYIVWLKKPVAQTAAWKLSILNSSATFSGYLLGWSVTPGYYQCF